MKKIKALGSFVTIIALLLSTAAPVFALGEDLTPPSIPSIDLCPNIAGDQSSVPSGMIVDGSGNCVTPAPADTTAPTITAVVAASITTVAASISWVTDELSNSTFEYGTSTSYGSSASVSGGLAIGGTVALTGLTAGTTYHYCIHATDASSNTANSCGHSFTTASAVDTTAPAVTLAAVTSINTTSATITWTTGELATAQVEYGTTSSHGTSSVLNGTPALTHSVTLSNLAPATAYHYVIKSADAAGNLTTTSDATFTTLSVSVQGSDTTPPVIANVASLSLGATTATIVWDTDELAVSTLEYGTTTSYGANPTISASALLAHTAVLTGLSANTTYHYCIHSTDIAGNVSNSCGHSFTTAATVGVTDTTPPDITLITITPITTTSATVNFTTTEVANAQIEYGTTAGYGTSTSLDTSLALTHSVAISGLAPDTLYHYRIRTGDQIGNQTIGSDETFTTTAVSSAPSSNTTATISGVESASISTTSATITWNTDIAANAQVEYGDSESFGSVTTLDSTLRTSHSVTINNLTPNTNYIFRVKSQVAGATVITTTSQNYEFNTLFVSIPIVPPANILTVSSGTPTSTGASIVWMTDKAATSQVEYGINTSYGELSTNNASMQTSHTVALADLTPNTTYHYRVKSIDEVSNITYSEDYTFATPASTGGAQAVPVAISTLSVGGYDQGSANLVWHVASASIDVAQSYDIRYSKSPISPSNWTSATPAQSTPVFHGDLSPIGTERSYIVAGLDHSTTYYFALRSKFENTNYGDISNVVSVTTTANTSVNSETASVSSGGGVSGTSGGYGPSSRGNAASSYEPTLVKAEPVDGQIVFSWKNPNEAGFVRTVVVRKEGGYPASAADGATIYEGRSETFTDANIQNGKTYFYAIYSYNHEKTYSNGIKISAAPNAINKEVKFNESGFLSPISPIQHFTRVFKKGDSNIEIEHLQEFLLAHGYPQQKIDGKFGTLTEKALKSFQLKHNPPPTGVVDISTQQKLNTITASEMKLDVPQEYSVFDTDLKMGSKNETVRALQQYLAYEGSLSADAVDGSYGQKTKSAVAAFQKKYNLVPDGSTGPKTRHKMRQLSGL